MPQEIILFPNDILQKKCHQYNFEIGDPEQLFKILSKKLQELGGLGLSAPQIGIDTQAFVFGDSRKPEEIYSVFNPLIVDFSKEVEYAVEGCLSFPGVYVKVKRAKNIRARFTTWDGTTDTIKLTGLSARIFQHEFDHLQGTLFKDRASKVHWHNAMGKRKSKLRKMKNVERSAKT